MNKQLLAVGGLPVRQTCFSAADGGVCPRQRHRVRSVPPSYISVLVQFYEPEAEPFLFWFV